MTYTQYEAIINVPGYSPMADEPAIFETAQDAWTYLADERQREEDDAYEEGDGTEYSETLSTLRDLAKADLAVPGVVYGDTPGYDGNHDQGLAYSVVEYEPEPEPIPVVPDRYDELLDLVTQYGAEWFTAGVAATDGGTPEAGAAWKHATQLMGQISSLITQLQREAGGGQ